MIRHVLIACLILFVNSFVLAQTRSNSNSNIPENWKTLSDVAYVIHYPDSFSVNTSGQMGTTFVLFSNSTSAQDLFRENINLTTQDLSGQNIDLNKYVEISVSQIKAMMSKAEVLESKRIKTAGPEFHRLLFSAEQGQFTFRFEQRYHIINDKAYVLTFTSESTQFAKYKDVAERIMNSFSIK